MYCSKLRAADDARGLCSTGEALDRAVVLPEARYTHAEKRGTRLPFDEAPIRRLSDFFGQAGGSHAVAVDPQPCCRHPLVEHHNVVVATARANRSLQPRFSAVDSAPRFFFFRGAVPSFSAWIIRPCELVSTPHHAKSSARKRVPVERGPSTPSTRRPPPIYILTQRALLTATRVRRLLATLTGSVVRLR
ncbi:hypothetical protein HPB50_015262 [Hyalomma asiaticum]|uniref:Uncharacterized protein n=1 Tax=Hyalomma asiaticum TaxID=266040 RepID=A0ACB7RK31_HYAAI|nr:hypothetical protein HPB50_015262 [Hyalomma asiaticum]